MLTFCHIALLFALSTSEYLSMYLSVHFFSELFESLLQICCSFTPKYIHIYFLKNEDILCN